MNPAFLSSSLSRIPVNAANIRILSTPTEFYDTLTNSIKNAKHRIYISSLYMGTDKLEQKLLTELNNASSRAVKISLLFDYLRGTRGGSNSCVAATSKLDAAEAFFFHTPSLRGIVKSLLPERTNEIVGLQHMKFYIFDNTILISGANLSDTYFTNRQDRYILFENEPELVEFFISVFDVVASCSYSLKSGSLIRHIYSDNETPDVIRKGIETIIQKYSKSDDVKSEETNVYPFLQMGMCNIRQEEGFMDRLFSNNVSDLRATIASGYLNFYDTYADKLSRSRIPVDVLLASPQANGFYGANGVSGYIPALYVHISNQFYQEMKSAERDVNLYEYNRPEWSFHAKGIWITPNTAVPKWAATVVGSSNFGYRSTFRDLEAQVLVVTREPNLIRKIEEERLRLMESVTHVDSATFRRLDHFVPFWVKHFAKIFRNFF